MSLPGAGPHLAGAPCPAWSCRDQEVPRVWPWIPCVPRKLFGIRRGMLPSNGQPCRSPPALSATASRHECFPWGRAPPPPRRPRAPKRPPKTSSGHPPPALHLGKTPQACSVGTTSHLCTQASSLNYQVMLQKCFIHNSFHAWHLLFFWYLFNTHLIYLI